MKKLKLSKDEYELLMKIREGGKAGLLDLTDHRKMHDFGFKYCPWCGQDLKTGSKPEKIDLKKLWEERKSYEYECVECGFPVNPKEEEACPICGSKKARYR